MVNWRTMTLHSFGFQVQCGGCEAWVTNVAAEDVAAAHAGKGRCHDCVVKSPVIVEVTVPAAPEESVDAGAPGEEAEEDPYARGRTPEASPAPEAAPAGWGAEDAADPGEPEGAPLKDEAAEPEETPRKRR